jgi:hypothetical protein
MRTACFARAPQRCTSRPSKHFLLTFQEVTLLSKTRNQLYKWVQRFWEQGLEGLADHPRPGYHRVPRPAALAESPAVSV